MKRIIAISFHGGLCNTPLAPSPESLLPGVLPALLEIQKKPGMETILIIDVAYPKNQLIEWLATQGIVFDAVFRSDFNQRHQPTLAPIDMLIGYSKGNAREKFWVSSTSNEVLTSEGFQQVIIGSEQGGYNWYSALNLISKPARMASIHRKTNETEITMDLNIDGKGEYRIDTGIYFFNHMLEQFARHSLVNLDIKARGDLYIDEHHTIEDTALVLGEAIHAALGEKRGIERYGFHLPMDEASAEVTLDFCGRPAFVWEVALKREKVGDMPVEMVSHFFKSLSDAAKCNLHIKATGENEHHIIEAIFKAFAKAFRYAASYIPGLDRLPTTKGLLS